MGLCISLPAIPNVNIYRSLRRVVARNHYGRSSSLEFRRREVSSVIHQIFRCISSFLTRVKAHPRVLAWHKAISGYDSDMDGEEAMAAYDDFPLI